MRKRRIALSPQSPVPLPTGSDRAARLSSCRAARFERDCRGCGRLLGISGIVALVGVRFLRPASWATGTRTLEWRNRIEQHVEELAVADVGRRQEDRKRNPMGVDHRMALAPRSAPIRRVRADTVAPRFAATVELSRAARLQSISSAQLNSWSNVACNRFHTPRRVQLRKRRQHVDPLPHPISNGDGCRGSAVCSTKRTPVTG